jgi:hypothetical protein
MAWVAERRTQDRLFAAVIVDWVNCARAAWLQAETKRTNRMNRSEYVTGKVKEFVEWVSKRLDDDTFAHAYRFRRRGKDWACASLFNAYELYYWPHKAIRAFGLEAGSSSESSVRVLETLQNELNAGLEAGDNERVRRAAIGVMQWGGVENGNVKWLNDRRDKLCDIIGRTRDAFDAGDTEHSDLADRDLRLTSGMSKVYSLVCKDFVIYDSRVAAALGRAVVQFCEDPDQDLSDVPPGLAFPWAPSKASPNATNPPRRYPGKARFNFPRLVAGRSYAVWNMKTSWLLDAIIDHFSTQSSGFARLGSKMLRLRALEAALFMIGYDLGGDNEAVVRSRSADGPDVPRVDEAAEWFECETGAHGSQFEYQLGHDAIDTRRRDGTGHTRFPLSQIDETLRILSDRFGTAPFPLANSATKVREGTAPMGLGTAYFTATRRNPPDTSRLGAVLEDMGVFEVSLHPPSRKSYWTFDIRSWEDKRNTGM